VLSSSQEAIKRKVSKFRVKNQKLDRMKAWFQRFT
jgi:membrane protein DedA with SNARE-associated domain